MAAFREMEDDKGRSERIGMHLFGIHPAWPPHDPHSHSSPHRSPISVMRSTSPFFTDSANMPRLLKSSVTSTRPHVAAAVRALPEFVPSTLDEHTERMNAATS